MKTFYISNYETSGDKEQAVAISHPTMVPLSYVGTTDDSLAPTIEMLNEYHDRQIDHDTYERQYLDLLTERGLTLPIIVDKFEDETIFVCFDYEDGDVSICHRNILADWISESGLAVVKDLTA